MKIGIDLDELSPNASLSITQSDIDQMWNYLHDDTYYFEEQILDYLIANVDQLHNPDNKAVELMNKLNAIYCNA